MLKIYNYITFNKAKTINIINIKTIRIAPKNFDSFTLV